MNPLTIDVIVSSKEGQVMVCKDGYGISFDEELAKKILHQEQVQVIVDLKDGEEEAEAYGCDLTYEYVRINGEYRS